MSRSKTNTQTPIGRRSFLQGTGLTALGLPHLFAGGQSLQAATPGAEQKLPAVRAVAQSPQAAKVPTKPLVPWMYMIFPLEQWLSDYERTLDAWADGGVRGLIIGPLVFYKDVPRFDFTYARRGVQFPTFRPEPAIYRKYGVDPPNEAPRDPQKERQLHGLVENAAARGWDILFFGAGHRGRARSFERDPFGALSLVAGIEDTMRAFPQARGVVVDGAGEHHYELAFHHGGELFELRENEKPLLQYLGKDLSRIERGIAYLRDRMHQLTHAMVRYYSAGGLMGGLSLLDLNEDVLYWLRARQEVTLKTVSAYRKQIDGMERKARLGIIPRTASFSLLTTQDYLKIHPSFDYIFPKHYFWNRGFDGMYGTVARWVKTLGKWNPGFSEQDCFAVVKCFVGLQLPTVHTLADLEMGFPDEFFSEVVYAETRRALDAVDDDNKVIAWVSTGRNPHAGDPMPAGDLQRILVASQRAGLKRFVYHPDLNLGAAEWSVISRLCGKPWQGDPNGYWPPDTPKPDTWNGGRKPPASR
jgi:hypothetical protein